MREFFQKVKDVWKKITDFLTTEEFIFYFPLAVFAVASIVLHSVLLGIVTGIWVITVFHGSKEKRYN